MRLAYWLFILLMFCGAMVWAAEGRIPISGQTTISASGSYIVTNDFTVTDGFAIKVDANHVTIDLDGHTITCDGASPGAIILNVNDKTDIHVRNGKLVGGDYAIRFTLTVAGEFSVENMTIVQPPGGTATGRGILIAGGAGAGDKVRAIVRKNTVIGSIGNGIELGEAENGRVEENMVKGSVVLNGIVLDNADNNIISANTVTWNNAGILVVGSSNDNLVIENNLSNNVFGLTLAGTGYTVIDRNTVARNGQYGLKLDSGRYNTVTHNNISGNGAAGVQIESSDYNDVKDNTLQFNSADGIQASASNFNMIERNTAAYNGVTLGACGIRFVSGAANNLFANNRTLDNGVPGCTTCGICGVAGNANGGGNLDVP